MKAKHLLIGIGVVWVMLIGVVAAQSMDPTILSVQKTDDDLPPCYRPDISRDNIRILVNEERLKIGHEQFVDGFALEAYAVARANEIYEGGDYGHETKYTNFYHWVTTQPAGYQKEARSYSKAGGEVLMKDAPNACETVKAWMNSPTHKDVLLKNETGFMGIGIRGSLVVIITAS